MAEDDGNTRLKALIRETEPKLSYRKFAEACDIEWGHFRRILAGRIPWPQWPTRDTIKKTLARHGVVVQADEDLGFTPGSHTSAKAGFSELEEATLRELLRREALGLAAGTILGGVVTGRPAEAAYLKPLGTGTVSVGRSDAGRVTAVAKGIGVMGITAGSGVLSEPGMIGHFRRGLHLAYGNARNDAISDEVKIAVATLGSCVGLNLFDRGNIVGSQRVWLTSLRVLRGVPGCAHIRRSIITDWSRQMVDRGEPRQALELLGILSGQECEMSGRSCSLLYLSRARAAAANNDPRAMRRYLEMAYGLYSEPDEDEPWNYGGWFNHAELMAQSGRVLSAVAIHSEADRDEALTKMDDAVKAMGATQARPKLLCQVGIIPVHAARQDTKSTVDACRAALATIEDVSSVRVNRRLHRLLPALAPMQKDPEITDVMRSIRALPVTAAA